MIGIQLFNTQNTSLSLSLYLNGNSAVYKHKYYCTYEDALRCINTADWRKTVTQTEKKINLTRAK